jgi:hypothetical protein
MIESGFVVPTLTLVALATWLPAGAFVLIMIFLRSHPRQAAGVSIAAVSVSLLSAVWMLIRYWHMSTPIHFAVRWVASGDLTIPFGYLLDPVSLLMLTVVAVISFLVQVYSLGYMAGDPGFGRYYAFMSFFAWAMTSLTVSLTLIQLYIFWELVGLASYLLIGFWYEKFSASEAGKKAFVMTRLGDVAFFSWPAAASDSFRQPGHHGAERSGGGRTHVADPSHGLVPADFRRHHRQERPIPTLNLVAGCHGRPDPRERFAPLGHHGGRGRLPLCAIVSAF